MKKLVVLVLGILALSASGCQGIKVVDNTYDSIGGKKFHVAEDFEYKGVVDAYTQSYCADCPPVSSSQNIKVRSDLFVKSNAENKVEKFAFIERRLIGGNFYWLPVKGNMYTFDGYPYAEMFFFSNGSDNYSRYYLGYLAQNGYDLSMKEGVVCMALERNFDKHKKGVLAECVNTEYLPRENMSEEEIHAFLRKDFEKVFSMVE